MPFDLLSEPIRRFIRDKRWEQLRPIQAAAITKIMTTDYNYILASRTASGKTEAAFLPILSKVDFKEQGVQVLYISPLIALINDQFNRVEELCKYLDISVTKWHGEANKTLKERLIKQPNGIVLVTPESLEAMFINKPYNVKHLFSNLRYVVIDEIHSFIGTDRGVQLKSLLYRIQSHQQKIFTTIGLSATIGDYDEAKRFTGDSENTKVLLDRSKKEINVLFRYFEQEGEDLSLDLLKDLYKETKDNKVLIFPNSRGRAEEIAVKLKKISERVNGHPNYFSHHSSVDREVREYVEYFAKNNTRQNFCISCTSTLELGIDIGTVDEVVQIDATHSIASLIQRVGRSGRREGEVSNLFLYATNRWSLLQSLACWILYVEGFIEPPFPNKRPYDILLHQALSIAKGHSGILIRELITQLRSSYAFTDIDSIEIEEIITHLIQADLLEKIRDEVIIGIEGEKLVNNREFYTVFATEDNFKVVNASLVIGDVPFSPQLREDENILLAAKVWKIKFVDEKSKRVEVVPAKDGKKPVFFGSGAVIHGEVRKKMLEIIFSTAKYEFLDEAAFDSINEMRNYFSHFHIKDFAFERPILIEDNKVTFFSFASTKVNRTFNLLLNLAGIKSYFDDKSSTFELDMSYREFLEKIKSLDLSLLNMDYEISNLLATNPTILDFSKWGRFCRKDFRWKY